MEPFVKLLLLFWLSIGVNSVPIVQPLEATECASRCRPDPRFVRFDSGKTYFYRLETKSSLGGVDPETPLSLSSNVILSVYSSGCDLSLQLAQTRIEGVASDYEAQRMASELEATPLRFGYSDGYVTDLCSSPEESDWSLNVKKAVLSALQMTSSDLKKTSFVLEKDFQGLCETSYQPMSERFGKHVILKRKNLQNCEEREQWISGLFPKYYSKLRTIPLINGTLECIQSLESDLIFGVTCHESQHVFGLPSRALTSDLNLRFDKQTNGFYSSSNNQVFRRHEHHLKMTRNDNQNNQRNDNQNRNIESLVRSLCQSLDQNNQSEDRNSNSIQLFNELIERMKKNSNSDQIVRTNQMLQQICPSNAQPIRDLYLDACAQSGSEGGAQVVKEWFQNNRNSIKSQVLFQLLSFSSEPEVKALNHFIEILEQNSNQKHVVLGVTSFIHNLKHVSYNSEEVTRGEKRAIDVLIQKLQNNNEFQTIVAIKGLQNIGLERSARAQQELARVALQSESPDGVRVSALKALSSYMTSEVRPLVMKVFENERNSNELRLNAYKSLLLSGSERTEVQRIKALVQKTNNQDIKQYVRSHVQNLKETSDPHKKYVIRQEFNDVINEQPIGQWVGVSNNFETSFMFDALGVGAVLEADVIYEREEKSIPTSFVVNTTFPLFGRELNLIELELRQKGFENTFKQKFEQIFNNFQQKNSKKFIQNIIQTFGSLNSWQNSIHAQNAFFEVHVRIDGKHVLSYNSRANESLRGVIEAIKQLIRSTDGALIAVQPFNSHVLLPTTSGFPLQARVNSTLIAQLRPRDNNRVSFAPSITWQTEAGLQLVAKGGRREVGVSFSVESKPIFDSIIDYSQKSIDFKVFVPKEKISLFRTELIGTGSRSETGNNGLIRCSEFTRKPFGIELCFEKSSKKFEIFVRKVDKRLQSFDFHLTRDNQPFNYHVVFDTPNSEVERRLELQMSGNEEFRVSLVSPWRKMSLTGSIKAEENNKELILQLINNNNKELDLNIGLETVQRGQKREFRPRVRVTWRSQEVINVGGSVSLSKGRKNQLMINLEGNQKQFLKGSLVREGERKSSDFRLSSDISLQLFHGFELKLTALLDKSPKHVTNDLQIDYKVNAHARKESLKTSVKLQSLSQSESVRKLSAFGEITSTQYPQYNTHVAYNLLNKQNEHVENELTLQWGRQLSDKVHVLQVAKMADKSHVENTWNVVISPLNIDYELRANGEMTSQQNSVDVTGKDRTGRNGNDFKANFRYKHVSNAPLHLTLEASLKTNENQYIYQDELREESRGDYRGVTSVKWGENSNNSLKMAKMEYKYKMNDKKEKNFLNHEMEVEVTSPFTQPIKHSALLRMSRNEAQIKSRLLIGSQLNHNLETLVTNQGPSNVQWAGLGYDVSAHASPYTLPQRASIEVNSNPYLLEHKSVLEVIPKTGFRLKSDTKRENQNLFAFESNISNRNPSKISLTTQSLDGSLDYSTGNGEHVAKLELNHVLNDWRHSSSLRTVPSIRRLEINSKTVSNNNPIISLKTDLNNGKKNLISVSIPPKKTSVLLESNGISFYGTGSPINGQKYAKIDVNYGPNFRHLSEYSEPEAEVRSFSSKQIPLYSLDFNSRKGFHSLNSEFNSNYELNGEMNSNKKEFNLNLKNKKQDLEQKLRINRNDRKLSIESQVKKNGQNLAEISGHVTNDWDDSEVNVNVPRVQTRAFASLKRNNENQLQTRVQYNSPRVEHVSSLNWPRVQNSNSKYSLDSKTVLNDNQLTYSLAGSHVPNRKSFVSIKTPSYDVSGHVDQNVDTPSVKVSVIGPKVEHVTEVSGNRNRKSIRLESRTDRKSNGENIYNFDSNYYHLNEEIPSNFNLKTYKNVKINAKVKPFGTGNRFLTLNAEHPDYSHVTDIQLNPSNSLAFESRTSDKNGRNLLKINSFLPKNLLKDKSHVSFVSHGSNANIEVVPNDKSARFEFQNNDWNHKSNVQISRDQTFKINSLTKYQNENYFDLNSEINPQKVLKIAIKTPNIGHQTHVTRDPEHVFSLDSNTDYNSRNLNKIKVNSNEIEFEVPQFTARGQLSNDYGGTFQYKSRLPQGRHVLAAIHLNSNPFFSLDVDFDQKSNENQRIKLQFDARDANARLVHVFSANYAGNEVSLTSDVAKRHVVYGPNTWSLKYSPKYMRERDSMEVKVSHVFKNGGQEKEMECRLQYIEGQNEKLSAILNTKVDGNDFYYNQNGVSLVTSLQLISAQNRDLNLKVNLRARVQQLKGRNASFMTELKAISNQQKEYSVSLNVARDQQNEHVFRGEGTVETPTNGRQELNFELNSNQNSIEFNAKSVEKKLLELKSKFTGSSEQEKHVIFDLKSNIRDIPSVYISGDYLRSKELSFRAEVNGERKAEVSLIRTGNDYQTGSEWNLRIDSIFYPKFETKLNLKSNSFEKDFEIISKVDSKELFSAFIVAKRQTGSGIWTGNARISQNGAKLAEMALQEVTGSSDAISYIFSAKNGFKNRFFGPLNAFFNFQKLNQKSTKISINFSKENENKFLSIDGTWKTRDSGHVFPERAEVSVYGGGNEIHVKSSFNEELNDKSDGQSVLGVTSGQRVRRKARNELSFSVNQHKMGFSAIQTTRGRFSQDLVLSMEFPNGKETQVLTDYYYDSTSGQYIHKTEIKDNLSQKIIFFSELNTNINSDSTHALLKYKSFSSKREKRIEFWFKRTQNSKIDFKSKMIFDLTETENNLITIQSEVQRIPETEQKNGKSFLFWNNNSNNNLNTSFVFDIQSRDKRQIDVTLRAHASSKTLGFELTNQNRNGRRQFVHVFVQSEPSSGEERRFSAIASTNQNRYRVEGAWLNNQLSYTLTNERTSERNDVKVGVQGSCVTWEARGSQQVNRKYDLCLNFENRNDKTFELSLEETQNGGKQRHVTANIEVDTRAERLVKIEVDWTPEWVQNWIKNGFEIDFTLFEEILTEIENKWSEVVLRQSEEIFSQFSDQIQDLLQELAKIFGPFERIIEIQKQFFDEIYGYFERFSQFFSYYIQNYIQNDFLRPLARNARKQCNKMEICYKLVYGLEKYGFDSIIDYLQWNSIRLLKETHKLVVSTSGRLYNSLPVPNWLIEYRQSISDALQSIIESNETLKTIFDSINRLLREVTKDWNEINGTEVKKTFFDFFGTIFDISSQKVVFYDPKRGRFSIQVKDTPLLRRSLRSVDLIGRKMITTNGMF